MIVIFNILYIHTHDTGKLVSPYGYNIPTPNYEDFCRDAMLFHNAFSAAPTCSPSRAALLTGVYPHQNGMLGLAQRGFILKKDLHLANFLTEKGFLTALCGVQHEVGYYTDHSLGTRELGYQLDLTTDNAIYDEEHLVDWDKSNADSLIKFLNKIGSSPDLETPFFISYGMHSTHRQYPKEIADNINISETVPPLNIANVKDTRKDFAQFETSAQMADMNLGKIIKSLKENNLYESTIIILTTDHGIAFPFAKSTLDDSGIGVLAAIRVPNTPPGDFDGLVSQIDFIPTLLDLEGIEKPDYLEGNSFASLFKDGFAKGDDFVFSEVNFHTSYEPIRSVRSKRYKYIKYFDNYDLENLSNIDDSITKNFYLKNGLSTLHKNMEGFYDLYYDKFETNNLINQPEFEELVESFRHELKEFMIKTNDPLLNGPIHIKKEWKVNKRDSKTAHSKDPNAYDNLPKR